MHEIPDIIICTLASSSEETTLPALGGRLIFAEDSWPAKAYFLFLVSLE